MIINEYLMILLILMILRVVNSLHRDYIWYMEMNGEEMVILPCDVWTVYAVQGCVNMNKYCVKCHPVVSLCYIGKPHGGIFDMSFS